MSSSLLSPNKGKNHLSAPIPVLLCVLVGSATFAADIHAQSGNDELKIAFPAPVVAPKPNGFDLYVAAYKALVPANPPVDQVNDSKPLLLENPKLAAKNYSLARKTAWLRSNKKAFALFQKALRTPSRHPNTRNGTMNFSHYSQLRELARSKTIEGNAARMRGDWNGGVTSALDTIQMGNDISVGGPLIGKLVGSAIMAIGRASLATPQNGPEKLNAKQARAAMSRLEAILKRRATFTDALKEEKWFTLSEFARASKKPDWRKSIENTVDFDGEPKELSASEKLELLSLSAQDVAERISASHARTITLSRLPYSAPKIPQKDNIAEAFLPSWDTRQLEGREVVGLNLLLLRLALHTYKLENGRFPTNLKALAPKYLKQIPTDYYADHAPFHYRVKNDKYELWSVGPDGKNDNAKPIGWRNARTKSGFPGQVPPVLLDSKGDWVAGKNR